MINWRYILIYGAILSIGFGQNTILNTKHNLSVSGIGDFKATQETQVCIFCHATHGGDPQAPLWNRSESAVSYTLYGSPSMDANTQQPLLASRLCLSCHDGTVALGLVLNRTDPISFPVGMDKIPPSYRSNLSDDLGDDHPLNIDVHPTGFNCGGCHLTHPVTTRNLECTSCHNPHDNQYGNFLNYDPINGGLCTQCHNVNNWNGSTHNTSNATWNGNGADPWPYMDWSSVSENACNNCHTSHGGASLYWLLKSSAEEDNCLVCHNGNVATKNIQITLLKPSTHPVSSYNQVHNPEEDPTTMAIHVECSDCHNPHETTAASANPPDVAGPNVGVTGVDKNGTVVTPAQYQYEICLKCHQNIVPSIPVYVPRVDAQNSIRLEFAENNPSFHPVYGQGQNTNVPSLKSPYTENSIIYCTDCHNNDEAGSGNQPQGPHGSNYPPLLSDQMVFTDYNNETSAIYALCYKCHDRNSILGDQSFRRHKKHIERVKASCTTCHDPHGSYNNTHLINFNTDYVSPDHMNRLQFIDDGNNKGRCYLRCHNKEHKPMRY